MTSERIAELRALAEKADFDEEWRTIEGRPDYEVSNFGHVRSYLKKGNHRIQRAGFPRLLKLRKDTAGRMIVSLPRIGKDDYINCRVASLVAAAFIGPRPPNLEIAHLNGDSTDNRATNMIYATHRENESHKRGHGTLPLGERNGQAVLLGWQVAEMGFLAAKGIPAPKIAALFDVKLATVAEVLTGNNWSHVAARTALPEALDAIERVRAIAAALALPGPHPDTPVGLLARTTSAAILAALEGKSNSP